MSSQTPNLNLVLPIGTEKVSRQIINDNNTKIDTAVGANSSAIAKVQNSLAYIVGNTNTTGGTLAVGQFVYVKNHSTIAEGLRTVTASISANGNITTSNTSACSEGGLNALNSKLNNIILKGSIESNSSKTLEPILQEGCHTLTLKRSEDYVIVCYDWWSSGYVVTSGSIPTGITITKNSYSHNVTVASTRSSAISFELT